MKGAYLDCASGISGDMTLGALLSLGVPVSWLEELPARLGVGDVRVTVRDVRRAGITCKQIAFAIPEQTHGRHVGELLQLRAGIGRDDPSTAVDHRPLGPLDGGSHLFDLRSHPGWQRRKRERRTVVAFQVAEAQTALVTRFGGVQRTVVEPGLHFKLPIDQVTRIGPLTVQKLRPHLRFD